MTPLRGVSDDEEKWNFPSQKKRWRAKRRLVKMSNNNYDRYVTRRHIRTPARVARVCDTRATALCVARVTAVCRGDVEGETRGEGAFHFITSRDIT